MTKIFFLISPKPLCIWNMLHILLFAQCSIFSFVQYSIKTATQCFVVTMVYKLCAKNTGVLFGCMLTYLLTMQGRKQFLAAPIFCNTIEFLRKRFKCNFGDPLQKFYLLSSKKSQTSNKLVMDNFWVNLGSFWLLQF